MATKPSGPGTGIGGLPEGVSRPGIGGIPHADDVELRILTGSLEPKSIWPPRPPKSGYIGGDNGN